VPPSGKSLIPQQGSSILEVGAQRRMRPARRRTVCRRRQLGCAGRVLSCRLRRCRSDAPGRRTFRPAAGGCPVPRRLAPGRLAVA